MPRRRLFPISPNSCPLRQMPGQSGKRWRNLSILGPGRLSGTTPAKGEIIQDSLRSRRSELTGMKGNLPTNFLMERKRQEKRRQLSTLGSSGGALHNSMEEKSSRKSSSRVKMVPPSVADGSSAKSA